MNTEWPDSLETLAARHARKLIRWCLAGSGGLGLKALVRQTDMDERVVRREVARLVREGKAFVVRAQAVWPGAQSSSSGDAYVYRWNHDGDFGRIVIRGQRSPAPVPA